MKTLTPEEITLIKQCLGELLELEQKAVDIDLFWDANDKGRDIQGEIKTLIKKL